LKQSGVEMSTVPGNKLMEEKRSKEKLIVALDVRTPAEARALVAALRDVVGMFKIGSQLFTTAGPEIVKEIIESDAGVFLDLKFHDIPIQVAGAARAATELGVSMFTVHASGGGEMMSRAAEAVSETAARIGLARPRVVAVTVLTSVDSVTLSEIGIPLSAMESVLRLAKLAANSGMDGVVASPLETQALRTSLTNPGFLLVTPGVRPAGGPLDDQKRVTTPAEALRAGADYLVIGRPITGAKDPLGAVRTILAELESA
jgi:orotidine-5'-phosphate decarboxylase